MTTAAKSPITLRTLAGMKQSAEKIASLTAYDATFTVVLERAGIEVLLVGDSLGMVIQGRETTLPVTMDDMVYHCASVARTRRRALLVADMPFMSYGSLLDASVNAARLMKEGGAHMVKLEGAAIEVVRGLSERGVPVCGHLGLLPQSVHKLGGYRVRGRSEVEARNIAADALALQAAGAELLVLECVPRALAGEIARALAIPVIGIGAGPDCDGQVLVVYDMLGMHVTAPPRFAQDFLRGAEGIEAAIRAYVQAVKTGQFPGQGHSFD